MRRVTLTFVMGVLCMFAYAQNANVQIIHNSPDPAATTVDIYLDNGASPAVNDLAFREGTAFLPIPTSTALVGIAPGNSSGPGDIIANFPVSLMANQDYVVMATGVLDTAAFDRSANSGTEIAFTLKIFTPAQQTSTAGFNDLLVYHGATDAPAVDVLANGNPAKLIDNAAYGDFQGYAPVPSAQYVLDVNVAGTSTTAASYYVDLAPLAGNPLVVFASGFLNPANNGNGPAFGLFAVSPAGGLAIPLTTIGNARAQIIHNSPDVDAAVVDVYVNTTKDTLKLDDVAFRSATGFIDFPTNYGVEVVIAGPNSTDISDQVVFKDTITAADNESYHVIASGLVTPANYNTTINSAEFGFIVANGARETGTGSATEVDLRVLHGSTDAPAVGIAANAGLVVPTASYGDITGYLPSIPATEYRIDVTAPNDPSNVIAPFYVDAAGLNLGGSAALVFASGFLEPSSNQNGEAFGLYAITPAGGAAEALTAVDTAFVQVIHNAADPAAAEVTIYVNTLVDTIPIPNFEFRDGTAFLALPSGYELDLQVAAPTSTGFNNGDIATFPATLNAKESYRVIANGVLDTSSFAKPSGRDIGFTLFIEGMARQVAANSNETDIIVFHGATDAPVVDVIANGDINAKVVDSLDYGKFSGYLPLAPAAYELGVGVNPLANAADVVATYAANTTTLAGGAGIIVASGFLDAAAVTNGEAFGLILYLDNGMPMPLSLVTSLDNLQTISNRIKVFPNPSDTELFLEAKLENAKPMSLVIVDNLGQVVMNKEVSAQQSMQTIRLDVSSLATGSYRLILTTDNQVGLKEIIVK